MNKPSPVASRRVMLSQDARPRIILPYLKKALHYPPLGPDKTRNVTYDDLLRLRSQQSPIVALNFLQTYWFEVRGLIEHYQLSEKLICRLWTIISEAKPAIHRAQSNINVGQGVSL